VPRRYRGSDRELPRSDIRLASRARSLRGRPIPTRHKKGGHCRRPDRLGPAPHHRRLPFHRLQRERGALCPGLRGVRSSRVGAGVRASRSAARRGVFPGPRPRHRSRRARRGRGRSLRRPSHVEPQFAPAVAAAQLRGERVWGASGDLRQPADWRPAVGSRERGAGSREQGAVRYGVAEFTAPCSRLPAPIESLHRLSHIHHMRVTTWAEYGLIVSVNLAKRAGQGPVAARELAEQERLPHDYVEQILLRLRRAGLVDSVRGAKGGYHLAREPQVITVKDVIEASEHVTFEVNCDLHPVDPQRCSPEAACSIRPVWRMLEQRINDLLAGISLADLTHDEPELYHIAGALAGN